MKVLNIIIYNSTPLYELLKEQWTRYMNIHPNVISYFVIKSPHINSDYLIDEYSRMILIKGNEGFIPHIFEKTAYAIKILLEKEEFQDVDFVIRTNMSSFWRWDKTLEYLKDKPKINFVSASIYPHPHIEGLIYPYDERVILYPHGCAIIMSKDVAQLWGNNIYYQKRLDDQDDVTFGKLLKDNSIQITPCPPRYDINYLNIKELYPDLTKIPNDVYHIRMSTLGEFGGRDIYEVKNYKLCVEHFYPDTKPKLLLCIAFHFVETRYTYLKTILENYISYNCLIHIIIDTNSKETESMLKVNFQDLIDKNIIEVYIHNLEHPFHLTWMHRSHMLQYINDYDIFMYAEDDMNLTYDNFINYMINFKELWPRYIPALMRVEIKDNIFYNTDNTQINKIDKKDLIYSNNKIFFNPNIVYQAAWILPQNALIEGIKYSLTPFNRVDLSREAASLFPIWDLSKKGLVQIAFNKICSLSYIFHITNNYVNSNSLWGKIKMSDLLEITN